MTPHGEHEVRMSEHPREKMSKQVLRKEDGRQLIMYRFKPVGAQAPSPTSAGDSAPAQQEGQAQ